MLQFRCGHFMMLFVLFFVSTLVSAASWSFTDATVSVQGKGTGVGAGLKEKLNPSKPLTSPVQLGASDTLKIILTTQDGKTAKRPHQAFLVLQDPTSNLDVSYPFSIKETGKAKLDLTQKDLPTQFLTTSTPVTANLVIASFGSSTGYNSEAFPLSIQLDSNTPVAGGEKPERYGKLPEIHHIFRPDPKSPNVVISFIFSLVTLATPIVLFGTWLYLGGNVNHLSKAFNDAPVAHALFLGSIVGLEGVLFMYYTSWNLFQTLPVLGAFGLVAFLSGSRALTEVQERRLAGLR